MTTDRADRAQHDDVARERPVAQPHRRTEPRGPARRAGNAATQRLADAGRFPGAAPTAPGRGLDSTLRTSMETAFGTGFGDVRVHRGPDESAAASALNATAYTLGHHIVFGGDAPDTATDDGRLLLAHELAHVVQQRMPGATGAGGAEADADRAALGVAVNGQARATVGTPVRVARAEPGYLERLRGAKNAALSSARQFADDTLAKAEQAKNDALAMAERLKTEALERARQAQAAATGAQQAAGQTFSAATQSVQKTVSSGTQSARSAAAGASTKVTAAMPALKAQGRAAARDAVKTYAGAVEGVWLEGANIVDTGMWAVTRVGQAEDAAFGGLDDVAKRVGLGDAARGSLTSAARGTAVVITGGTIGAWGPAGRSLREAASLGPVDPVTGKPLTVDPLTGAPMTSALVTKVFDRVEGAIDDSGTFDGAANNDDLLTAREKAHIAGSVGSQAGLALVGGEEVMLGLKVLGAVGAVKNIEHAALKNATKEDPHAFLKSFEFWAAVGNLVLFMVGLRAASSSRKLLRLFIDAAMAGLATAPAVLKYAHDLQHAQGPDRDQVLHEDVLQLARAGADVLKQIVLHQAGAAKAGARLGEEPAAARPAGAAEQTPTPKAARHPGEQPVVVVKVAGEPQPTATRNPYREPQPPTPEKPYFPVYEKPPAAPPVPAPAPKPAPAPAPKRVPRRIDPPPFLEPGQTPAPEPDLGVHPSFKRPPPKSAGEPATSTGERSDAGEPPPSTRRSRPPEDPYDVEAWKAYYRDNPDAVRSLSAAAVDDPHAFSAPTADEPAPASPAAVLRAELARGGAAAHTQPSRKPAAPTEGLPKPQRFAEGVTGREVYNPKSKVAKAAADFERWVAAPYEKDFPGQVDQQLTVLKGKKQNYRTKDASRLDTTVHPLKLSIDAKKYSKLATRAGRNKLIYDVVKQARQRAESGNLPEGYQQAVVMDGRGQNISDEGLMEILTRIPVESGGAIAADKIWIVL